jgi:hypothetical protein
VRRPSVFSREYKRKMRARKKRMAFLAIVVVIFGAGFLFRIGIKNWLVSNIKTISVRAIDVRSLFTGGAKGDSADPKEDEKINEKGQQDAGADIGEPAEKEDKKPEEDKEVVESYYELALDKDTTVKVVYEEVEGEKIIRYVQQEGNNHFNISPSGRGILVQNSRNQDVFYMDNVGKITDITRKQYVSGSKQVFEKYRQLERMPDYLWHGIPKFIDEENIVYVSSLPWLDKRATKYIWKYNLNTKAHINIFKKGAVTINFDKITERGLSANIDGKDMTILPEGKVVE